MNLPAGVKASPALHAHETTVACKNCGHRYEGRFCPACGQRAATHRINWHYIWHEIPHSVWHVDHGILFTLKELFTRPGYTIREFLEGKRVRHYRPLALILLLGAILTFVVHGLKINMVEETQRVMGSPQAEASAELKALSAQVNGFTERNMTLIQLFMLPVTTFFFWLFFRKKDLNYPEHLVANTFLINVSFVPTILSLLLFKLVGGGKTAYTVVMSASSLVGLTYHAWAYAQMFKGQVKPYVAAIRSVLAYLLSYVSIAFIAGLIGAVYGFFVFRNQSQLPAKKPATEVRSPLPQK